MKLSNVAISAFAENRAAGSSDPRILIVRQSSTTSVFGLASAQQVKDEWDEQETLIDVDLRVMDAPLPATLAEVSRFTFPRVGHQLPSRLSPQSIKMSAPFGSSRRSAFDEDAESHVAHPSGFVVLVGVAFG